MFNASSCVFISNRIATIPWRAIAEHVYLQRQMPSNKPLLEGTEKRELTSARRRGLLIAWMTSYSIAWSRAIVTSSSTCRARRKISVEAGAWGKIL
ncbi:hypothetical protein NDU88_005478 [Pleurodeles waltl]|uniref:Uncharacterized protein n=1 Tax=Pleurodeles waltl TaxID=8319 RepID=A0AAV7TUX7_PLEWA|nr:hypothetical protein NDU88_005478 [Pleurodeles waltl]